ncbi:MAG: glycosyltransferase family 25 protein [Planctomycetota bacterium]
MDQPDCVHWCISLKRRKDRRFIIDRSFPSWLREQIRFWEAVDARQLGGRKARAAKLEQMDARAYAVRLSKLKLLREFLSTDASFLCMYEDDVCILDGFQAMLETAMQTSDDWDVFFLGGIHHEFPTGTGSILQCVNTYANHCLLFNREGARKLKQLLVAMPRHCRWSDRELAAAVEAQEIRALCPAKFVVGIRANLSDNTADFLNGRRFYSEELAAGLGPDDAHLLHFAVRQGERVLQIGKGPSTGLLRARTNDFHQVSAMAQVTEGLLDGSNGMVLSTDSLLAKKSLDLVSLEELPNQELWSAVQENHRHGGLLIMRPWFAEQMAERLRVYRFEFNTPIRSAPGEPQGFCVYLRK